MTRADVAIIGGGPAGMICAVQLKRYGIEPVLFERKRLGGLLWNANLVENYPGFPGGIPGAELAGRMIEQFESQSLAARPEEVTGVDHDGHNFLVTTGAETLTAEVLVVATGTQPNRFPAELIPPQAQSRVFYEVADLQEVGGKTVAVIGAGDAAFDYALQLARRGSRALIFNRGIEIRSLPLLVSRAETSDRIEYHPHSALTAVRTEGEGLSLQMVDGSAEKTYKVDMLLGALGRTACLPAFSDRLAAGQPRLSTAGQFHLIGDVHNGIYRQTAIAAGDGLRAAMIIYQYLKEQVA